MNNHKSIPISLQNNFYLNVANLIVFSVAVFTGLVLQIEYHMHHLPNEYLVMGQNKTVWLLIHRISSAIALAGIVAHCAVHWKFITTKTGRILERKSVSPASLSYWLFVLCIPTCLTAMSSWIFFEQGDSARHSLVEIHDKLALLFIVLSTIHIISRAGSMIRVYRKLK